MAEKHTSADDVHVSVGLSGPYDDVISKLSSAESSALVPESILGDIRQILRTVRRIDGGTRSRITDSLPDDMSIEYDSELLVELLRVLEAYELVALDGNTWNPGPQLPDRATDES